MNLTKIVMIALAVSLGACQKEDSAERSAEKPAPTREEMLTSKTWILSAMTIDPEYMGQTDIYDMLEDCEQDNTMKFSAGTSRTVVMDEAEDVCSGHAQQSTASWDLDAAGTTLTLNKIDFTLKSLSSDGFKLEHTMEISGTDYTITETYIAK